MRFMQMCINEVLEEAKDDIAVIVKMNMRDGFKSGMDIDECLQVGKELEKNG